MATLPAAGAARGSAAADGPRDLAGSGPHLVGVVLTLAIVVPLGWMWWNSLLPSSYSVMDMGYADYGGGPRPPATTCAGMQDMAGMEHMASGVSVPPWTPRRVAAPTSSSTSTARQGTVKLASGKTVEGYTSTARPPGRRSRPRSASSSRCACTTTNVDGRGGAALARRRRAQRRGRGRRHHPGRGQAGQDHTYRWVAPHAGTFWYHSHQMSHEQVPGGLLGGIVIHPERPEPGVVGPCSRSRTSTTVSPPSTATPATNRGRPAGPARPRPGGQHRQRPEQGVGERPLQGRRRRTGTTSTTRPR